MAAVLLATGLFVLIQAGLCSPAQTEGGCKKWKPDGNNVCCEICYPGHRLVSECGPNPRDLCTPCRPNFYTLKPKAMRCFPCKQCVGVLVQEKACTATSDTQCGCKAGFTCGDQACSFCVTVCDKGEEPENRSCRPCPEGTFNDQPQQKCKPWSTSCPNPNQKISSKGNAFNDITCTNATDLERSARREPVEETWLSVSHVITGLALAAFVVTVVVGVAIVAVKVQHKKKEEAKKAIPEAQIIRTPTDDPRTLIAIECSFHEAQQEQGSSSGSLASKDSSELLLEPRA